MPTTATEITRPKMAARATYAEVVAAYEELDAELDRHGDARYSNMLLVVIAKSGAEARMRAFHRAESYRSCLFSIEFNLYDLRRHFAEKAAEPVEAGGSLFAPTVALF